MPELFGDDLDAHSAASAHTPVVCRSMCGVACLASPVVLLRSGRDPAVGVKSGYRQGLPPEVLNT